MGNLNQTGMTLMDIARGIGGAQPALIDILANENSGAFYRILPMRQVAGWVERFDRKTGRPSVSFRSLGSRVTPSKGKREAWQEGVFLLSGYSEVDAVKADRDPRGARVYREEQDKDYLESIGYTLSQHTFYGSNGKSEGFDGLFKRLPSSADTFVSAGGSEEGTSIYAVKLGPNKFMGIYNVGPKGALIEANDYDRFLDKTSEGVNEVYGMFFNAAMGIAQYHPKSIGRIGKIDASHKPSATMFTTLFGKMGWKPDVLVTTWTGAGYISELKLATLRMSVQDKNFDIEVDNYAGVPIIVDPALSDAEGSIEV
jgi:hypothetical protein